MLDAGTQENSLRLLHDVAERASVHPDVIMVAKQVTQDCPGRDDRCELDAILAAVKFGDPRVPPLATGVRYVRDPRSADYFTSPIDLLRNCMHGACAEDCDGHALLICALAAALGWKAGLRAYGEGDGFSHVYAVVAFPKLPTCNKCGQQGHDANRCDGHLVWSEVLGLDSTVAGSKVGWEPPRANVLTAWLE